MNRRFSTKSNKCDDEENREFSIFANPRNYKFKNIKVVEPAWVGDAITGHRTYRVISETANDFLKVIRRYSQFEAFRNILVSQFPECIVPVLPPKTYTEKITSDESDPVNKRIRGLKRFLETVLNHSELNKCEEFIKFLRDSDFPVEFISKDSNTLDEDTSILSKYMYSLYKVVKSTVSGSDEGISFESNTQNDLEFDKYSQKLLSLKEFTEKLLGNGEKLKQLFSDETDNLRNFRSFVPKIDLNIRSIGTDLSSSLDDEVKPYHYEEEEKKMFSLDSESRETKDSVAMTNSESSISNDVYNIIIMIEDGVDLICSAIDAIERRRTINNLLCYWKSYSIFMKFVLIQKFSLIFY